MMHQHDDHDAVKTNINETEARQGVTGHNVRYVLLFGLLGVVVVFAAVLVTFLG